MNHSPTPSPHPRGNGLALLAGAMVSFALPGLWLWRTSLADARVDEKRAVFANSLASMETPAAYEVPFHWVAEVRDRQFDWSSGPIQNAPTSERFFRPRQLRFYEEAQQRGEALGANLVAPTHLRAEVDRLEVRITWRPGEGIEGLQARLQSDPVLSVRYRVYRWREGEEPVLLDTPEIGRNQLVDRDLPLWEETYYYSVATTLEGQLGGEPTLIDSRRSGTIDVRTLRRFDLDVIDGQEGRADVVLSLWEGDRLVEERIEVLPGRLLAGSVRSAEAEIAYDTGFTVSEVKVEERAVEEAVRRAEFLPDGRRKIGPDGRPSFLSQPGSITLRTVHVAGTARGGDPLEFRSLPLR